ncbi:ATP-binding protein [Amphritea balenae]|uniref:histidine kinase n=1 Tax=Amphritea balenae TaxID=452629 RepID=A0A3P1SPC4_9GAMM|nr:ATP-binding protein [Amphritea balenae]RRC99008.1 two-component sensor histidine kinase [Amphritea balenae]GGK63635.1 two-component sensor histidine kinase [Amphritea balenae]
MMPRALRARLLLGSLLLLPVFFGLTGFALQQAFHHSLEAAEEERLKLQVYLILGAAELDGDQISIPDALQEPRYSQLESGLYGFLHGNNKQLVWSSESAKLINDPDLDLLADQRLKTGESLFYELPQKGVFVYQFALLWEIQGREHNYLFTVLESSSSLKAEQKAFNTRLWGWLGAAIFLFLLVETLLIGWGLKPLTRLAADLKDIEQGQSDRLTGEYPTEVQAVTDNLNLLIKNERQQRERYRNTLGDLAHSLKTPLAVMRGAGQEKLSATEFQTLVSEQAGRMDQIVQYQLARAVKSQGRTLAKKVAVAPLIERMLSALQKVYRDKNIEVELSLQGDCQLAADERDLMELLGNVLENAFKYGYSQVSVSFSSDAGMLQIDIADDGEGVSPDKRQTILKRGERADTSAPGQGIGLSVAVDILSSYDGELAISEAALGGALFSIRIPLN